MQSGMTDEQLPVCLPEDGNTVRPHVWILRDTRAALIVFPEFSMFFMMKGLKLAHLNSFWRVVHCNPFGISIFFKPDSLDL